MKRGQAVRIHKHLIDALVALDDAPMAIAGLGKEERLRFDGLYWEVVAALQDKLLEPIHGQFPDLEPPVIDEEIDTIDSELRWDQVRLPPSVTESDLDGIIFSVLKPLWQKTAKIVTVAVKRCEEVNIPISYEEITARLQVLSDSDRVEAVGDLRMWRYSEVRLKD